ncbi:MAG: hypothetical protein WA718_23760 [Terriglobales bacterium]
MVTLAATITELPDGQHAQAVATASLDVGAALESDTVTSTTYASGVMTVVAPNTFVVGEAVEFLDTVGSPATPTPSCIVGGSNIQIVATIGTGAGSCGSAGACFTVKTNGCSTGTISPSNGVAQGPVGYQVLNIAALDPVYVQGSIPGSGTNPSGNCSAFTTSTSYQYLGGKYIASGLAPLATIGSTPWNGTWTGSNYSVTYPWIATPGTVDDSGTCVLTNLEGGPGYMTIQHTTLVTDAVHPIGEGPSLYNGPIYMLEHLFQNSITLGSGGWSSGLSGIGEGTPTEEFVYDPNSMSADYLVWPGRAGSSYTEYGNNLNYQDEGGTCGGIGCTPPNMMYFPANSFCNGAVAMPGCVGFVGATGPGTTSMPLTLPDYHGFALLSGSSFHNAASDGADIGVILPSLDSAQTSTTYVCTGPCGWPGPFPD